jgi:hypothetical protein
MYILSVKFKITSMVITIFSKCKNATIPCRTAAMAEHTYEQQRKKKPVNRTSQPQDLFSCVDENNQEKISYQRLPHSPVMVLSML